MAGDVAFSIRNKGCVSTRLLHKSAAQQVVTADLYRQENSVFSVWAQEPPQVFAPQGYGLVVVDFDTRWVGSIQGYARLDQARMQLNDEKDIEQLRQLWHEGRVTSNMDDPTNSIPRSEGFDDYIKKLKRQQHRNNPCREVKFGVDPPQGWKIQEFSRAPSGWHGFAQSLVGRGFAFSDQEWAAWDSFLMKIDITDGAHAIRASIEARAMNDQTPPSDQETKAPSCRF